PCCLLPAASDPEATLPDYPRQAGSRSALPNASGHGPDPGRAGPRTQRLREYRKLRWQWTPLPRPAIPTTATWSGSYPPPPPPPPPTPLARTGGGGNPAPRPGGGQAFFPGKQPRRGGR